MPSHNEWFGVHNLIDNYIGVRPGDYIVLCFSPDSVETTSWVSAYLRKKDVTLRLVPMAPLVDPDFAERLASAIPKPSDVSRLLILTFEKETMSHDRAIRSAICIFPEDKCQVYRSISSCPELFSTALHPTPDALSALNTALLERLMPAKTIRVTSPGGTDLMICLDSTKHRWISNRGRWRPGSFVILPAGEVATYPSDISGVLVADFAFNVNAITHIDARLDRSPITVEIENGRAVRYYCDRPDIMIFLEQCFSKYCAYNVGELGLGTNTFVTSPIELNSHINERCPGIHLGFGQHNQGTGVDYQCNIHLDLIANGGVISIDDDGIPLDLHTINPSQNDHPTRTRDEDVFSPRIDELEVDDCCGILTDKGLTLFDVVPNQ